MQPVGSRRQCFSVLLAVFVISLWTYWRSQDLQVYRHTQEMRCGKGSLGDPVLGGLYISNL